MLIQEARIRTDSARMLYASAAVFQIWMPRWQKSQQPKLLRNGVRRGLNTTSIHGLR